MDCVFVYMKSRKTDLTAQDVLLAGSTMLRVGLRPYLYTNVPEQFNELEGWHIEPMIREYTGWWCVLEAFRHPGPCIFCGIDTLFLRRPIKLIDRLQEPTPLFGMIYMPLNYSKWFSSVMAWNTDMHWLYSLFWGNPNHWMNCRRYMWSKERRLRFEQDFTADQVFKRDGKLTCLRSIQHGIHNWNKDIQLGQNEKRRFGIPQEDTTILFFNGFPRPKLAVQSNPWLQEAIA